MRLGVIGYGVVGSATADVLRRLGHTVLIHDTMLERQEAGERSGYGVRRGAKGVEVDFICVPEADAAEAITGLTGGSIIVLRSTVTPGTTDRLGTELGRPLLFMPEFLREATANWDALNPHLVLIGSHEEEAGNVVAGIFAPLMSNVVIVKPAVAEMVKLSLNSYLHTIISFWNEIHLICERIGLPSHLIGRLCAEDPRVPAYGAVMHGNAVGGRCLPKDLDQLIAFARELQYSPDLLVQAQQLNGKMREQTAEDGRRTVEQGPEVIPSYVLRVQK
jgi:UDPglucose 6-dehydrogenase